MTKRSVVTKLSPMDRLILALGLLVGIVGLGTAGFVVFEHTSFLNGLYMTLATISTLGMKVGISEDFSIYGQIWIMFLIVVGIAAAMIALTTAVSIVVEGHMRSILGRRKVNQKIASLSNHIIVCGYGRMGRALCQNLKDRHSSLVIIDNNTQKTARTEQDGLLYILGDATEEAVLVSAGIERAGGLVAVLDSDAANVFATLVARDLNRKITIAARAERVESETRLIRAGANTAICPQVIGATRLANILTRPGVVDFIDFAAQGLELEAEQYRIGEESKLVGQTLRQANLPRQVGVLVIALRRRGGQTIFNPEPDLTLQAGDTMIITGRAGSMAKLGELDS